MTDDSWTPLHQAAMTGDTETVRSLVLDGADPAAGCFGNPAATPRRFALFYGRPATAALLPGPLQDPREAAGLGDLEALSGLLTSEQGFGFAGPPQWFPPREKPAEVVNESLSWAARSGQLAAMQLLVDAGADVNSNPYRGTPLLWAVFSDEVEAATWLVERGADPDLRHDFGGTTHGKSATVLHLAAQYSRLRCLRMLLERGADATVKDELYDATPLGWAEHEDQQESVAILRTYE